MKAIFGVLALVVVLAVVASLVRKQLSATGLAARGADAATQAAAHGAAPVGGETGVAWTAPRDATVPEQAATLQQQAKERTVRALQQGADRNERANP